MLHGTFRSVFARVKVNKIIITEHEKQIEAAGCRISGGSHRATPAASAEQMLSKQDLCYSGSHSVIVLVSAHWLPSSN